MVGWDLYRSLTLLVATSINLKQNLSFLSFLFSSTDEIQEYFFSADRNKRGLFVAEADDDKALLIGFHNN